MKFFGRMGQKTSPKKSKGIENGSNSRKKTVNQVWHVSCIRYFHGKYFKRTWNLLRGISRSARGV
jgi:hypothetical protein